MKSAERHRNSLADESYPEVGGVSDMPEVYKLPMVRMRRIDKRIMILGSLQGLRNVAAFVNIPFIYLIQRNCVSYVQMGWKLMNEVLELRKHQK